MSDEYYIRIRGAVKGPLTREQIVAQIRRKRLGRHHELSIDAVHWEKAGDMPDLFRPVAPPPTGKVDTDADDSAPLGLSSETDSGADSVHIDDAQTKPIQAEWFYAQNGQQSGPVSESDIRRMVSTGELASTDLIWSEGFEKWTPAGETAGFASAFIQSTSQPESVFFRDEPKAGFWETFMGTSKAAVLPSKALHKYPNLTRYLRMSETALRIFFVLALSLFFAGWFYEVGKAVSNEQWLIVGGGIIAGPLTVLLLWLLFTTMLAVLELIRVIIKIEDNTSKK